MKEKRILIMGQPRQELDVDLLVQAILLITERRQSCGDDDDQCGEAAKASA